MKKLLLAFVIAASAAGYGHAQGRPTLLVVADRLGQAGGQASFEGNVRISVGGMEIAAPTATFDFTGNVITSGDVKMTLTSPYAYEFRAR